MNKVPVDTTIYSLNEKCPSQPERRTGGERHLTLFRVGTLLVDGRRELCLIKNISAGGMLLRAYCTVRPGQAVAVELKTGHPLNASVSWADDGQVGLAFAEPIDVIGILAQNDAGPRPRMPRIETSAYVTVREGANSYRMRICDISQGGVKLECPVAIAPDTPVVISMIGMPPQPGTVRWHEAGFLGVSFNRLIRLADLVEWIRQQRSACHAA